MYQNAPLDNQFIDDNSIEYSSQKSNNYYYSATVNNNNVMKLKKKVKFV